MLARPASPPAMFKTRCASVLAIPAALLAVCLFLSLRYELPQLREQRVDAGQVAAGKRPAHKPVAASVEGGREAKAERRERGGGGKNVEVEGAGGSVELGDRELKEEIEIDALDPEEEEEEEADGAQAAVDDAEADMKEEAFQSTSSSSGDASHSEQASKQTSSRSCFVYDRPPRTGSTTVAKALKSCLVGRGYRQPLAESRWVRTLLVGRMLALAGEKVGLLSRHMYMSGGDVQRLRKECAVLLYVSSCKPMRERLWSAAKYRLSDGNGNSSLSEAMKDEAVRKLGEDRKTEMFLEGYPYLGEDEKSLGVGAEGRLVPDYVVRAERMEEDLGKLLEALKCEGEFESRNVHQAEAEAEEESRAFLKRLRLRMGDETFRKLNERAERGNEEGLRKVAAFR